jgi:multidrug efflux system membrane fusion protein
MAKKTKTALAVSVFIVLGLGGYHMQGSVAAPAPPKARLALARTELARSNKLIVERAISQREQDQRANDLLEAQAALSAAQADVQSAQLNLQYTTITAPVTGPVSRAELTVDNLVGWGRADSERVALVE